MKKPKTEMVEIGRGTYIEKKKQLKQGKDYDAWAWKNLDPSEAPWWPVGQLSNYAVADKPKWDRPTEKGKWIKVKFLEVE